jgi:hypothetical protein
MKPTFDPNKPYQTRDGRKADLIATFEHPHYKFLFQIKGAPHPLLYTSGGAAFQDELESCLDLINIPEKKTVEFWVNVYPNSLIIHERKKQADIHAFDRTACLHIVWEYVEGEGL